MQKFSFRIISHKRCKSELMIVNEKINNNNNGHGANIDWQFIRALILVP